MSEWINTLLEQSAVGRGRPLLTGKATRCAVEGEQIFAIKNRSTLPSLKMAGRSAGSGVSTRRKA
jgi:hypothetical protein